MVIIMYKFNLKTDKYTLYNITEQVMSAVSDSKVTDGICIVYSPHTTASITINENTDSGVEHDILLGLAEAFPDRDEFLHMEGNSHAHLKASCIGPSETIIIENGQLVLGTWQAIYFCEFDGPRSRRFFVKIIGE